MTSYTYVGGNLSSIAMTVTNNWLNLSNVMSSCQPGYYFNATSGSCLTCTAGTYSGISGATVCTLCPAGSYSLNSAESSCTLCSAGYASSVVGASNSTVCQPCSLGYSTDFASGAVSCLPCAAGFYSIDIAAVYCQSCPSGYASALVASTSNTCTSCSAGYYSGVFFAQFLMAKM